MTERQFLTNAPIWNGYARLLEQITDSYRLILVPAELAVFQLHDWAKSKAIVIEVEWI